MERLSHMLDWWVKNGEQLTWSAVVRALFGIRMRGLAKKIAVKYAVPGELQMAVITGTDPHLVHITSDIQHVYSSLEERDEELTMISESLPAAKKRNMVVSSKHKQMKKQLTTTQTSTKRLLTERNATRRQLEVKEGELKFLKQLQEIKEKKNDKLQEIITNKETEILLLRDHLAVKENELSQAREEVRQLRENLQQTTAELAEKSMQVRELERVRADIERERSRADRMMIQLCATNQGLLFQLEKVTPAELDTLKQAVKEKEEEVGRLSSQLEAKEAEKQKLLTQVERQSQQGEDQLVQLTTEVCELRASLMEAEDRRMRAEVELEDLKSRKSVINQPVLQNCKVVGRGLKYGETNQIACFQVHLTDASGEPCVEKQDVSAELKSLVDGSIIQAEVSHQTRSVGSYNVSYEPHIRGRYELSVFLNGLAILGSPFRVYVQQPPQLMDQPVRVIRGLSNPRRATWSSSGQLVVTEDDRISVFDGQGELVHRIDSLGPWYYYYRVKLNPTGVAIDDSGVMYVCDVSAHKVFKVSSTGEVLTSVGGKGSGPGQFNYPDGIALRDNKVYICDVSNDRIQIFSCDLNFISSFGSRGGDRGEFRSPRDIVLDQEGNMYVAESNNNRVQVLSPSGTFLRSFGQYSAGIYMDHDIFYLTVWGNYRISAFTALGEHITSFDRRGSEEGEFINPCKGITMDCDGFLYVCDSHNDCIQIF